MNILTTLLVSIGIQSDTLYQMADTVANGASSVEPTVVEQELSMWELCLKGGIIMIPLLLLSVVSIYVLVERFFAIRKAAKEDKTFMKRIKDYIHEGEIESAMNLCKKTDTPYSRLILKGITRIGRPMNDVLVAIENVGNLEVAELEKGFICLHQLTGFLLLFEEKYFLFN